jgi:hypothetical protein
VIIRGEEKHQRNKFGKEKQKRILHIFINQQAKPKLKLKAMGKCFIFFLIFFRRFSFD